MKTHAHLSIGVITTDRRTVAFAKLLDHLKPAVEHYAGNCELVVVNNSGASTHATIETAVAASGLRNACPCIVVDSPKNNIATARNLVLDHSRHALLVLVDDDEFPTPGWLSALLELQQEYDCDAVAGPIVPVFAPGTAAWVRGVDIHNARGLARGDQLDFAASGNVLIHKPGTQGLRFDEAYGKTGGSDTDYFLRLKDAGVVLRWAPAAIVHEDIPADRSTVRYTLRRCLIQGRNYRRILQQRRAMGPKPLFLARALSIALISLPIAGVLMVFGHDATGVWVKRAFSNLGKLYSPGEMLYG